jgi:hypothetical protein
MTEHQERCDHCKEPLGENAVRYPDAFEKYCSNECACEQDAPERLGVSPEATEGANG